MSGKRSPSRSSVTPLNGIVSQQVYMVSHNHHVSGFEVGVEPSGRAVDEQESCPQFSHYAHRKGCLLKRVAFVVMESSLHDDDASAGQCSKDKVSLVPLHS